MDADFSHNPYELKKNVKKFNYYNCDILISSRYLKSSKILNWPLSRLALSKIANWLAKILLKIPVSDFTNGYRIYSRRSVGKIIKNCGKIGDGFIILSEMLLEIYINNYKIKETNTIFVNRKRGESSVTLNLFLESLIGLFKLYFKKIK